MSELFSKNFKKHSTRAKEKLLESLGKADRTTDEEFEDHATNFAKQQKSAERLQKELKNYVSCIKAMSMASKSFHEAVRECYEPEWPGVEHVKAMSQSLELLWEDYHEKMVGQALSPLTAYSNQFADMKNKMSKRGRKLVDYDSARHNYEAAKNAAKSGGETKALKANEQLLEVKKLYEDINGELLEELPALYDSRITFYVNNVQTIFNLEHTFHAETGKMSKELCVQMDELGHALGKLRVPRRSIEESSAPTVVSPSPKPVHPTPGSPASFTGSKSKLQQDPTDKIYPVINNHVEKPSENGDKGSGDEKKGTTERLKEAEEEPANPFDSSSDAEAGSPERRESATSEAEKKEEEVKKEVVKKEEPPPPAEATNPEPAATPTTHLADQVLYKVRATHRYTAEDSDELSFEPGEVISVIPCEDPDEMDEGWLNGFKDSDDGKTGVFPANFTRPL